MMKDVHEHQELVGPLLEQLDADARAKVEKLLEQHPRMPDHRKDIIAFVWVMLGSCGFCAIVILSQTQMAPYRGFLRPNLFSYTFIWLG